MPEHLNKYTQAIFFLKNGCRENVSEIVCETVFDVLRQADPLTKNEQITKKAIAFRTLSLNIFTLTSDPFW